MNGPGWKSCARGDGTGSTAITPTSSKRPGPRRWVPSIAWPSPTARVRSITSLAALGIGPGDEVIVPPYTFVATINAVLMHHALPVFVDTDPETFQIDARKIEAAITERTACIMPVHLGGSAADMDTILAVAKKHKLPVVEDACQAHLAEWRTKKVSTLGDLGCFSFQASKNLNAGEGGAILTNSDDLYEQCKSFQNNGRMAANAGFAYVRNGANLRITEFQGALLLQQLTPARGTVAPPRAKRGLPARSFSRRFPASRRPRCTRAARAIRIISTCFAMIPSSFEGLPRSRVHRGLTGRGNSGRRRLPAAVPRAVLEKHAPVASISGDLLAQADLRVPGADPVPGQRAALRDGASG